MRFKLKGTGGFASALLVFTPIVVPNTSLAYPIDCAILLCLSGGWPASAECTAARAEFIRRITPWPIEPPLQIWRCPMSVALQGDAPAERLWSISATALPAQTYKPEAALMRDLAIQVAGGSRANVDISGPAFDFVRSIKVYDIDWWQRVQRNSDGDENCFTFKRRVNEGSYGTQGDFSWDGVSIHEAPAWMETGLRQEGPCDAAGRYRAVGVEWTDYFGAQGFELVRY